MQAMRELYAVQSHQDVELAATAALLTAHQAAKVVDHDAVAKLSMQLEVRSSTAGQSRACGKVLQKHAGLDFTCIRSSVSCSSQECWGSRLHTHAADALLLKVARPQQGSFVTQQSICAIIRAANMKQL